MKKKNMKFLHEIGFNKKSMKETFFSTPCGVIYGVNLRQHVVKIKV